MLEISPQGPSGLSGKICLCGIGAAGTKVMEEVLLLAPPVSFRLRHES